jgi:hypothetical protein
MKSWCLEMIKECLYLSSMRLGVPFIAPQQLGAVGGIPGRQFLPSVGWRTRQSGAPPNIPCSLSSADRLPKLAQPTVEDLEPLAHRTVRCTPDSPVPHQTVGSATRGLRGRPLARSTVDSPDSPVNFSRTPPTNSRERPVDQTPAWRTGHCLVPHWTVRCTQTA